MNKAEETAMYRAAHKRHAFQPGGVARWARKREAKRLSARKRRELASHDPERLAQEAR